MRLLILTLFLFASACAKAPQGSNEPGAQDPVYSYEMAGIWNHTGSEYIYMDLQYVSMGGTPSPVEIRIGHDICRYMVTLDGGPFLVVENEQIIQGTGAACAFFKDAISYYRLDDTLYINTRGGMGVTGRPKTTQFALDRPGI